MIRAAYLDYFNRYTVRISFKVSSFLSGHPTIMPFLSNIISRYAAAFSSPQYFPGAIDRYDKAKLETSQLSHNIWRGGRQPKVYFIV